ncbi:Planctomycete cytochrome C [Symmachiella macrocystis]|uniref:Planctomycete cytochrome C n=1 Tax=Symmachiella macrocystis TaxID=2527985 RepID=A0A5C6B5L7_9PLAN|nr:DUF1553 domain-containing protein [Symmachiella macrocystis]TWU07240.1 Planctomycete cytochrome C [Symmachiella macrocystis]
MNSRTLLKQLAILLAVMAGFVESGNAQAAPPQEGLILWLDASEIDSDALPDGAISKWTDKSGHGNYVVQEIAERRPTFSKDAWDGHPAVHFDGDDLLVAEKFAGLATGDRPFHILIVMRGGANSSHMAQRLIDLNSRDVATGDFPKRAGLWVGYQQGRKKLRIGIHNGDEGEGQSAAWNDHPTLIEAAYTGEQAFALHVNGRREQRGVFNGTHFLGFQPLVSLALGQHFGQVDATDSYFEGDIAEVLVYDRALTATQQYETGQYLSKKYALKTDFRPIPQFERDIRPILASHCQDCHGGDVREAELDLRTVSDMLRGGQAGPVIVRGFPDRSEIVAMIKTGKMPPDGENPLSADEVRMLRDWIEADAPSTEKIVLTADATNITAEQRQHWAYQLLKVEKPRSVVATDRIENDIDRFVVAKLEEQNLQLSPPANRTTLIRRVYFDLIGLPPTPEEIDAFISDKRPDVYERLVDGLLNSEHFGERWGRHWLDVVGYVDMFGSDNDAAIIKPLNGKWRYRDYVIRAFNADKPFDRFLVEQLAGDELYDWKSADAFTPEMLECLIATGFLLSANDDTDQNELNTPDVRHHVVQRTSELVANSLLALTLQCAKCHDHKYDALPQADYYRLQAVFAPAFNVRHWVVSTGKARADVPDAVKTEIDSINQQADAEIAKLTQQDAAILAQVRQNVYDKKLAALPATIREDAKTAVATPADKRSDSQKQLAVQYETQLNVTTEEIKAALSDEHRQQCASIAQQIAKQQSSKRAYGTIQHVHETYPPPPTYVLRRGNYLRPGLEVQPGLLSILETPSTEESNTVAAAGNSSGRRLALARQLTNGDKLAGQYVARVIVNRFWQQVFGRGIVATSDNFGVAGAAPSHPELLDWLTSEFLRNGWRAKPIIKQMVMSHAYRQAAVLTSEMVAAEKTDPENALLWRMNLRRLDSEYVRDAILVSSGKLDRSLFGEFIPVDVRPDGMVVIKKAGLPTPTYQWRRSIYVLARRNYHLTMLRIFDQPIVARNCTQREPSAVVTQALTLLHDDFVLEQAAFFAERLAAHKTPAEQITAAYRIALGRLPTDEEIRWCTELLHRQAERFRTDEKTAEKVDQLALAQLCKVLFNTNEYLYVR